MNKKVIMMLYPTRGEATIGHDKVFIALKDPIISHRKSDMIETADVRIHFHSISKDYYAWLSGYQYDNIWIDERIDVNAFIDKNKTLIQFIDSRKR